MLFYVAPNSWLPYAAAALLTCSMLAGARADSSLSSQSISLEIIVKFSQDSDAGQRVDRIFKEDPQDLSGLADLRGQLHRSTGFVLAPARITSGREVIVQVPEGPLLETIEQSLSKRREVASVELLSIHNENPRLPENLLLMHFRASSDESALLENAYGESTYAARVQALATKLCAASGVPVLGRPEAGAALAVTVDRYALLEKLVARLNDLDFVDYAQPNSTMQFMK